YPRPEGDAREGSWGGGTPVGSLAGSHAASSLECHRTARLDELQHKTQELEELRRILGEGSQCLERLPTDMRRSFLSRSVDTCEKLLVAPTRASASSIGEAAAQPWMGAPLSPLL
ncbi:unnamed protein product, partial [Polarella glacialis]